VQGRKGKALTSKETNGLKDQYADGTDKLLLQNCHDSLTTMTLDMQRLAPQLTAAGKSEHTDALAKQALDILKNRVEPSPQIQTLMMKIAKEEKMPKAVAENALIAAGEPFEELQKIQITMTSVVKEAQKAAAKKREDIEAS